MTLTSDDPPAPLHTEKSMIPVHRLVQTCADHCELRVSWIDQYVAIEPAYDARYEQDRASPLQTPPLTKFFTDCRRHTVPTLYRRWREHLVGQSYGKRYFNIVLVRWQPPASMHELFQQCRGIVVACVDQRATLRVPPAWRNGRAGGVKNRIGTPGSPILKQASVRSRICAVTQHCRISDLRGCREPTQRQSRSE